jgi:hypothetical protein
MGCERQDQNNIATFNNNYINCETNHTMNKNSNKYYKTQIVC